MKQYENLINIINKNLEANGQNTITFERYENLFENIYSFPVKKLLSLKTDEIFISEVFFKMLNRPISSYDLEHYTQLLKNNKSSREKIIQSVYNSNERKSKKTNILFETGVDS